MGGWLEWYPREILKIPFVGRPQDEPPKCMIANIAILLDDTKHWKHSELIIFEKLDIFVLTLCDEKVF